MKMIKHLDDGTIIGDPCHIIRDKDAYDEFLHAKRKIHLQVEEWVPFEFRGVSVQLYETGVDGLFFDVPVDTGTVMKVREEDFSQITKANSIETAQALFARLKKARKEPE